MFGNKSVAPKTIGTLIGSGTTVEGNLSYTGGLRIDGTVKGNVRCSSADACMVVVSEMGHVEGEVHAAHLVVSGRITGPVHVTELLELQPKARVAGDVHYRAIEIHQGAVVEGRLIYQASERSNKGPATLKLAAGAAISENSGVSERL
jgi:cytoskeletal protein CcmA (bactofilin family)